MKCLPLLILFSSLMTINSMSFGADSESILLDDEESAGVSTQVNVGKFDGNDDEDSDTQGMISLTRNTPTPKAISGNIDPQDYIAQGPDPYSWIIKLAYYKHCTADTVTDNSISKKLDMAEYYLLSPTFRFYGGYNLFQDVATKYESMKRSFPWKKVPQMLLVAGFYDKVVYTPALFASALALFYGGEALASQKYTESADLLNGGRNSWCTPCQEAWWGKNQFLSSHSSISNALIIDNTTMRYVPFFDASACPGVLESARDYTYAALSNTTWEDPTLRAIYSSIQPTGPHSFYRYNVGVMWGNVRDIFVDHCDFSHVPSSTAYGFYNVVAGISVLGGGFIYFLRKAIGEAFH